MVKSRKKTLVLLSAVILIGSSLTASWFVSRSAAAVHRLERYLPSDTIAFIGVPDLRTLALRIAESDAWQQFARANPTATSAFLIGANHAGILDAGYAAALLMSRSPDGQANPELVLVAEFDSTDARRLFERRALQLWKRYGRVRTFLPNERYADADIFHLPGSRENLIYARSDRLVVLSRSSEAVKKILDVRQGRVPSLESNPHLIQTRQGGFNDVIGFIDGSAVRRLIESLPANDPQEAQLLREILMKAGADSITSAVLTSTFDEGRVIERLHVGVAGEEGLARVILRTPPTPRALLSLVPEDAERIFDVSTATVSEATEVIHALLDHARVALGRRAPRDVLEEIRRKTGIDVQADILSSLGSEACVVDLSSGETHRHVLLVSVRDQARVARALEKLALSLGYRLMSSNAYGASITSLVGKSNRALLHYTFADGVFIASNTLDAVGKVLDTARSGRSLRDSTSYREALNDLPEDAAFLFYGSNRDYLNRLGRMLSASKKDFTPTPLQVDLKPSVAYGIIEPDGVTVESRSPLGLAPRLVTAILTWLSKEPPSDLGQESR
ncbi:MAG TPA: DUF3352 domain-containing protein [Blastocatellia bacterium]|nr:DUF3352 domain-containing protein [Blastocatellia bacterium]